MQVAAFEYQIVRWVLILLEGAIGGRLLQLPTNRNQYSAICRIAQNSQNEKAFKTIQEISNARRN
jgi:hypothetical protein